MTFWSTAVEASSQSLTEEMLMNGFRAMMKRDKWEREHPHGYSPENGHVISLKTTERLQRDGGWAMCASCYRPFYVDPETKEIFS